MWRKNSKAKQQSHDEEVVFQGGQVTALSVQKGNPDRVSLFVDDEFQFGLRREVAYHFGLKKGLDVTPDFLMDVWREEVGYKARDDAATYLMRRARSRQEIARHLGDKGYDETVVANTLDWLDRYGYVDDEDFAKRWVEDRLRFRPRGKAMLRWELQQKGVASDDIESALGELVDEQGEVEAAVQLLEKKVGRKQPEWTPELKRKLGQFLARKGFSTSVIYTALGRLRESTNLDND
ncbi:MAG TPA: regulatory protein RecX [Bacilli bacterium]|nr:regulatory protein RecX [Bacilli bacterium]